MTAIKVKRSHFYGTSKVFGSDPDALANIVRGIAIDNARVRVEVAAVSAFTDNSTGTAAGALVDLPIAPSGVFDGTSAGAVQRAAFNTSLGKLNADHVVMADRLNLARSRLGLPAMAGLNTGTLTTAGTIPALDLTATTSSSTSAVDHTSYVAICTILRANQRKLATGFQEVFAALGLAISPDALQGYGTGTTLVAPGSVTTAATGASSVKLADGTAFLAAAANNIASLATRWNGLMVGAGLTALTDSSGGTASTTGTLGAIGTATPFTTAATDCSPKAGFDTLMAVYRNTFSSFLTRANLIAGEMGIAARLVDSTAGTPATTIASTAAALSAVTGTTVCLDAVTGLSTLNALKANFATTAAFINTYLAPAFGVAPLIDSSSGVADTVAPLTLVAMPDTATGTSGAALSSVADTEMDANLAAALVNVATITAKLNQMLGTSADYRPLSVVAA